MAAVISYVFSPLKVDQIKFHPRAKIAGIVCHSLTKTQDRMPTLQTNYLERNETNNLSVTIIGVHEKMFR